MKARSRSILILSVLLGYILLQFTWWEILLVKQNDTIIEEKQKLVALASTDQARLQMDIELLQNRKARQTIMLVGEGTVFLLLLLYGVYKIKQSMDKENVLNNQQKNFFLSITHELKTPIAATKLQLQTLQKQRLEPAMQQELIAQALRENERLNNLIDNVLLSSRIEAPGYRQHRTDCDLSDFVNKLAARYYHRAITEGELTLKIEPGIRMAIDEGSFGSIITNLIDNAFKYSPREKAVTLALTREQGRIVMEVSDRGVGVAQADREKIFQKFFRVGSEDTRQTKGTGLGLYIVRQIVRQHNGLVRVKDNVRGGSVFEVSFA